MALKDEEMVPKAKQYVELSRVTITDIEPGEDGNESSLKMPEGYAWKAYPLRESLLPEVVRFVRNQIALLETAELKLMNWPRHSFMPKGRHTSSFMSFLATSGRTLLRMLATVTGGASTS